MKLCGKVYPLFAIVLFLGGTGCRNMEDYRNSRAEYAVRHFEQARQDAPEDGKIFTLRECLFQTVEHNLDLKVFALEENVAKELQTAEVLGMLPELNISDNFTHRNNTAASSSQKIDSTGITYGASTSQDRTLNYLNVDLALSVLDFGLAFFNSQQAEDRLMMREQRTRRARQNLVMDVTRAYFQVAAAQRAINITTQLLEDCRASYTLINELARERRITPFRAFDESKRFIDMEKRLTNYIRSYENSCAELRTLLGFYPGGLIFVDDSALDVIPNFDLPDVLLMEQIALLERPELYEIDIQKHINAIECRKTILMMFPNVRMFVDFTNSDNSFLYNQNWWEVGVRAAYNLLKLPQHIARYQAFDSQIDAEEARTYAQAIGVMAQVRIAQANLMATRERFDIDSRVFDVYKSHLDAALAEQQMAGQLSKLEIDHIRLATAETEIERFMSLGNYYVSYCRLLNAMGIYTLENDTVQTLSSTLDEARVRAQEELDKISAGEEFEAGGMPAREGAVMENGDESAAAGNTSAVAPVIDKVENGSEIFAVTGVTADNRNGNTGDRNQM